MTRLNLKMRVICFEGLDGAGKTTLFRAFEKSTAHYYACFDRWPPISNFVYDKFLGRHQDKQGRTNWLTTMTGVMQHEFNLHIVHVDTSPAICQDRRKNEEVYTLADYQLQRTYYTEIIEYYEIALGIPVLRLDGANHVVNLVYDVAQWLEKVEQS